MVRNMRKILISLMVPMMALAVTSCVDNVQSNFTPEIRISVPFLSPYYIGDTLHAKDTLALHYNESLKMYVTDTIQVGDTLLVGTMFYAYGNNLLSTRVKWDTTAVRTWFRLNTTILDAMTDTTQISTGYFPFSPNYNMVSFPIYFTPITAGVHPIEMTVETDSKYSPRSISFSLLVR